MRAMILRSYLFVFLLVVCGTILRASDLKVPARPGQSVTVLPDGRRLFLGGFDSTGHPSVDAKLADGSGDVQAMSAVLQVPRAGHTATVLPDGTIFIFGGMGADGKVVTTAESFDPASGKFSVASDVLAVPRAFHTATLLTDGNLLLAGGIEEGGEFPDDVQIWDYRTRKALSYHALPITPRQNHSAVLLPDGTVRIFGGADHFGRPVNTDEVFDPVTRRFRFLSASELTSELQKESQAGLRIAESVPADGATNVPINSLVGLRFTQLLNILNSAKVDSTNLVLQGPDDETIEAKITIAENGRLGFVLPSAPLHPGTTYRLTLKDLRSVTGELLSESSISFTTAGLPEVDGDLDWKSPTITTKFQELPPLQAVHGQTALAGQVLKLNGFPLEHVTLEMDGKKTRTDASGRFLLKDLVAGHHVLWIDGSTANHERVEYGIYEVGVTILPNKTNVLNYTIWMTRLDTVNAVTIPSPTTQETVLTNPNLPGLELHLAAGTVITDRFGKVVRHISITPIPIDKPPFPLPAGVQVPIYFTVQPGGAYLSKGARLIYPNGFNFKPGTRFDFWNYDADVKGWFIYGHGRVSADARSVVPDPGVVVYEFTGAMVGGPGDAPGTGKPAGSHSDDGDPVDLSTGQFIYSKTDMALPDTVPITFTRTYIANDSRSRAFGIGATDNYDMFMVGDTNPYTYQELILPDGGRIRFDRISSGTSFGDAVYVHVSAHDRFYGAQLAFSNDPNFTVFTGGSNWKMTLPDGTIYIFPDSIGQVTPGAQAAVLMQDRYGNRIMLTRNGGDLTKITSPNGRYINLTYNTQHRITQLTDSIGRTVQYTYDGAGRLSTVTDANNGVTTYTYDDQNRMLTIQDARGIVFLTNQYDSTGRVVQQTQADGSTYLFHWTGSGNPVQLRTMSGTVVSSGTAFLNSGCWNGASVNRYLSSCAQGYLPLVQQVDVTDPRGYVRRVQFSPTGYMTSDTRALGQPEQQTFTYDYYSDNLVKSVTDPLGRVTSFDYTAFGNPTRITRLDGTSNAVTINFTYGSFNQLGSITDPLNHTSAFNYDTLGNLISAVDALNHSTTFAYNFYGQRISATDALGNTVLFGYFGGDPVSVTDTLGNVSTQLVDAGGRVIAMTDAQGNISRFQYNSLNLVTQSTDALGNNTQFSYDANGNLLSLTDALNHATSYNYDNMDRILTRTDPLNRQEQYSYDLNGNLVSATDRKGQVTVLSYDPLNRLKFVGFNAVVNGGTTTYESTTSYTYDAGNRVTQVVDSSGGTITPTYDNLDRLTGETTPQGSISYTYDAAGRRTTMQVTNQLALNYTYDNADRLTQITQGSSTTGFGYDKANRRTSLSLPNGLNVSYSYDNDSRLNGISYQLASNTPGSLTYGYDQLGRRTQVGGAFARTGLPGSVTSATYDAANELINWNGLNLAYDANGNMLGDGTNTFTWNARNQVATLNNISLQYDAFGRRVKNKAGTSFLYSGANAVQELSGTTPTANLISGGIDEVFSRVGVSPLADALGSTVALADSSGNIQTSFTYDPFGNTSFSGQSSDHNYQYTGRENEGGGLYYYRARYYSPMLQRFISRDPMGLGGGSANLYSYAGNNPISLRDPRGHCVVGGLINAIVYDGSVVWHTLAGRKIDYYSGLSGAGHLLAGNAKEFAAGCVLGKAGEILADLLPVADIAEFCDALCFPAGTPVWTRNGIVAIEKIKVGDEILSRNMETGKLEYKRVTGLITPHKDRTIQVWVEGEKEPLHPTKEHPFFIKQANGVGGHWVNASALQIGDLILNKNEVWSRITAIATSEKEQTVYNFQVDETHNYFVGSIGLLVHNGCLTPSLKTLTQYAEKLGIDLERFNPIISEGPEGLFGMTDSQGIVVFENAFASEELLVKTMVEEYVHALQGSVFPDILGEASVNTSVAKAAERVASELAERAWAAFLNGVKIF